jgi:hypothetical protein
MTLLRVVITLVRMKIRLISAEITQTTFRNHTLRVKITLMRVKITLRVEIPFVHV